MPAALLLLGCQQLCAFDRFPCQGGCAFSAAAEATQACLLQCCRRVPPPPAADDNELLTLETIHQFVEVRRQRLLLPGVRVLPSLHAWRGVHADQAPCGQLVVTGHAAVAQSSLRSCTSCPCASHPEMSTSCPAPPTPELSPDPGQVLWQCVRAGPHLQLSQGAPVLAFLNCPACC